MAGDKQRASNAGGGARRTTASMKKAGVTPDGIALVRAVTEVLDGRWSARQRFVEYLIEQDPKVLRCDGDKIKLRKRLSKELGSSCKPRGPEWHVVELIATHCTDSKAQRETLLAKLSRLYCAARNVDRPPGYTPPPVTHSSVTESVIDRLQSALDRKVGELEQVRAMNEGLLITSTDQQAKLDAKERQLIEFRCELGYARKIAASRAEEVERLNAQVTNLTERNLYGDGQIGQLHEITKTLSAQVDAKEAEIDRLTSEVRVLSAQHVAVQQQHRRELEQYRTQVEEARKTIAKQQSGLHDALRQEAERVLEAKAAAQRYRNMCERYARLAAQVEQDTAVAPTSAPPHEAPSGRLEGVTGVNSRWPVRQPSSTAGPHTGSSATSALGPVGEGDSTLAVVDPAAPRQCRQLAVYLRIHLESSGLNALSIAEAAGIPVPTVESLLTAGVLPKAQQLAVIANVIDADVVYARQLYDEAVRGVSQTAAGERHQGVPLAPPPPGYFDDYESIVAGLGGDNLCETAINAPVLFPAVAPLSGDSDVSPGDNGDNPVAPVAQLSPPAVDNTTVRKPDDLVPTRIGPTRIGATSGPVLYRSSRRLRHQRRRQLTVGTVNAANTLLIPLTFIAAALALDVAGVMIYSAVAGTCLACWLITEAVAAIGRRIFYQGRHTSRRRSPNPNTITVRAAAMVPAAERKTDKQAEAAGDPQPARVPSPRSVSPIPSVAGVRTRGHIPAQAKAVSAPNG